MAEHREGDERLCGNEELCLVSPQAAEAQKGPDESELGKADRASGGGDDCTKAAKLVE